MNDRGLPRVKTWTPQERLQLLHTHLDRAALSARGLTVREIEVASHAAVGLANKEIASMLRISLATVKEHVSRVLHKLGVENRTELTSILLLQ